MLPQPELAPRSAVRENRGDLNALRELPSFPEMLAIEKKAIQI
jgi:hypothetical protein